MTSDRPQDETSKPPFERIFSDGLPPFVRMMQGPPDKIVREDNGQVWHYWKIQDDEDDEPR